jgi:Tol biopolymer transport system component
VDALEVEGERVLMVQGVQRATTPGVNSAAANFSFSDGDALVYLKAGATATPPQGTLGIVDRSGVVRSLNMPPANYRNPRASPDGRSIAFETMAENGQLIISVYDRSGNTAPRRLTQEGNNSRPIWTRDSKRIAYGSDREKAHGIWWQPADGSGSPERLTTAEEGIQHFPESWSPEEVLSFVAVRLPMSLTGWGLWTLDLKSSGKKPSLFYDLPTSNEAGSAFSHDGKWIAYFSNEGPGQQFGIFIQPYPRTGAKYEISRTGGVYPVWHPSDGELFYRLSVAADSNVAKIKAVTVTTKPVPGFTSDKELPIQGFLPVLFNREYDIMPSGGEFVMVFAAAQTASAPLPKPRIAIVLNWLEELKARVPHP